MRRPQPVTRVLVGYVPVYTKKLILADPSAFDAFLTDTRKPGKRRRDFSYSGACAVAEGARLRAGQLEDKAGPVAIVTAAPKNRQYPVYALVRGGKVVRLVISFDDDPCRSIPKTKKRSRKRAGGDV